MIYIATFYSHFGAVHFKKICESKKLPAKMMPVPRNLSSSCGTCVQYVSDTACPCEIFPEEMEQEDALAAEMMAADGNTVDYTA